MKKIVFTSLVLLISLSAVRSQSLQKVFSKPDRDLHNFNLTTIDFASNTHFLLTGTEYNHLNNGDESYINITILDNNGNFYDGFNINSTELKNEKANATLVNNGNIYVLGEGENSSGLIESFLVIIDHQGGIINQKRFSTPGSSISLIEMETASTAQGFNQDYIIVAGTTYDGGEITDSNNKKAIYAFVSDDSNLDLSNSFEHNSNGTATSTLDYDMLEGICVIDQSKICFTGSKNSEISTDFQEPLFFYTDLNGSYQGQLPLPLERDITHKRSVTADIIYDDSKDLVYLITNNETAYGFTIFTLSNMTSTPFILNHNSFKDFYINTPYIWNSHLHKPPIGNDKLLLYGRTYSSAGFEPFFLNYDINTATINSNFKFNISHATGGIGRFGGYYSISNGSTGPSNIFSPKKSIFLNDELLYGVSYRWYNGDIALEFIGPIDINAEYEDYSCRIEFSLDPIRPNFRTTEISIPTARTIVSNSINFISVNSVVSGNNSCTDDGTIPGDNTRCKTQGEFDIDYDCATQTLNFQMFTYSNAVTNFSHINWDFGDGSTLSSASKNVSHSYNVTCDYVTITAEIISHLFSSPTTSCTTTVQKTFFLDDFNCTACVIIDPGKTKHNGDDIIYQIELFSLHGKRIFKGSESAFINLEFNKINTGIYLKRIIYNSGLVETEKIYIE